MKLRLEVIGLHNGRYAIMNMRTYNLLPGEYADYSAAHAKMERML